ncbi:MAG: DNA alkylation repair protein [Planctomycetes bacterium]|nr:DNA alkylation repair protein [Planctomycetota bacterium]
MAEIPPAVRRALDEGRDETRTLVEWLAIDQAKLLASALPTAGFAAAEVKAAASAQRANAANGITVRVKQAGAIVHGLLAGLPAARRRKACAALAGHRSDMVRAFLCYSHLADHGLALAERLAAARRFAADAAMSVRECAWDSFRPALRRELQRGLVLLRAWVADADPNIRRCAVEGSRPRGVWTHHLEPLKADPSPGLPLLEPCRADPSDYVRKAVANWLNDASKSDPRWVRQLAARWRRESRCAETAWILRRGLRTLRRV